MRCESPDYASSPEEHEKDAKMPHFCAMKPSTSFDVAHGWTFRQMLKCLCLCGHGVAETVEEELLDEVGPRSEKGITALITVAYLYDETPCLAVQ